MRPIQIKRCRNTNIDPKQELRAHIDRLAIDQQRLFVEVALQLIATRNDFRASEKLVSFRQTQHELEQQQSF